MTDLTPVAIALLTLLFALIGAFAVPWLRQKLSDSQWAQLQASVAIAVQAAEQMYKGIGRGAEKLAWVRAWLAERGYTLDTDELDAMIEAAVYSLINGGARA